MFLRFAGGRLPAAAALLLALVAACTQAVATPTPSTAPSDTPSATPAATASPTAPTPSPTPAPTPTPTPAPTLGLCAPADLVAQILDWQGAAGNRIGDVQLTNRGTKPCLVKAMDQPQLVDGNGTIMINGAVPGASASLTVAAGGILKTMVNTSNYCAGPAVVAPVTVAFVLPGGAGRVVAHPVSATDTEGVPPCNGDPAVHSGTIQMHAWAP